MLEKVALLIWSNKSSYLADGIFIRNCEFVKLTIINAHYEIIVFILHEQR